MIRVSEAVGTLAADEGHPNTGRANRGSPHLAVTRICLHHGPLLPYQSVAAPSAWKCLAMLSTQLAVAEKLLKDVVPEGAPQEIISVSSKQDELGHRVDYVEYAYQWKFDDAMARQLRRKKFQLHCKAAVVVARKKQFVLTIASEENRWPVRGDDYKIAIDTFKLTY
ncbi:unnamed protein product [Symbiodinium natans]|uniref:PsbP C-terminal domain-containing protein n=1 Tax=Symbiodinium natans TaxID=878477 RepID=A0A812TLP8_9DINO|nr:unnamed protein product [Symbiodinium natans]